MQLDDILAASIAPGATVRDQATLFLNGAVEPDTDSEHFRLYQNPDNRRAYFIIKKADVTGELYQWTLEETSSAGFIGVKMYRIPLRYGCEIVTVSVTFEKLHASSEMCAIDAVKQDLDAMNESGETKSSRLQMAMDRLSKLMSTLSNILKKMSETSQEIVQNMK